MLIKKLQDDIDGIMTIARKVMTLNMKKNAASKDQDDQSWVLMKQQIINEAMKVLVLSQDQSQDKFMLISKLMNMRENLLRQIFNASLYRKLVIWNDLNIKPDEWGHQRVVDCVNRINDYQESLDYIPTKLEFEELTLDVPGYFSFSEHSCSGTMAESTDTLDATIASFNEMENLIKKNFMMQPEKLEEFANNNPTQRTLRD